MIVILVIKQKKIIWEHRQEEKRVFRIHRNTINLIYEQGTVLMRVPWKLELVYDYLFQKNKPIGVPLIANKCQNKGKRSKKSKTTKKEVKKQIFCNKGTQVLDSNMI